jgi:hypothetical protein
MMANRSLFPRRPGAAAEPERPVDVFVRGVFSGALVGAVIAGSAIWERSQRQRRAAAREDANQDRGADTAPDAAPDAAAQSIAAAEAEG